MHELGITESIINIVLDKAKTAQTSNIAQVNLVVGELSGFAPDCIQFYFDILSKDTIAQDAKLIFTPAPTELLCRNCSTAFHLQDTLWSCPECHSQSVEIIGGRELYVESMEVE